MKKYIVIRYVIFMAVLGLFVSCEKEENDGHREDEAMEISGFLPTKGRVGTRLLINGKNFTTDLTKLRVTINGKELPIIGASLDQIMVVVHDKVGNGAIQVEVEEKLVSSTINFEYIYTRTVSTLAGDGNSGFVNGPGNQARFAFRNDINAWYRGTGIVVDSKGNVYVADPGNTCIRKIDVDGVVSTFAGNPNQSGDSDGQGTMAKFTLPYGLAIDKDDNLFVVDPGLWKVKKISPEGIVSTYLVTTKEPWNIAIDKKTGGIFYGSTTTGDILRIEDDGSSTVIISGLNGPMGMDFDREGNLFVSETDSHVIRRFEAGTWTSSIISGQVGTAGFANGNVSEALFSSPGGLCVDEEGVVYVAGNATWDGGDYNPDQSIRFITKTSEGWGAEAFAGSNIAGFTNEVGTSASFRGPLGVAVDKEGAVYVLDKTNNAVRKIVSE